MECIDWIFIYHWGYQTCQSLKILPYIYIAHTDHKGRGVYTAMDISSDTPIETCPIIIIPLNQGPLLDQTELYNYYFIWRDDALAIALGYGSLYNHSSIPNARVVYDFESEEIVIEATRAIIAGEEITINYIDAEEFDIGLWFEEKE
jgi:uncharacterized protein